MTPITTILAFLLTLGRADRRPRVRPLPRRRGLRRQGAALLGRLRPRAVAAPGRAATAPSSSSARCRSAATCACSTSAKAPVAAGRARTAPSTASRSGSARRSSPPGRSPTCCSRSRSTRCVNWIGVDEPKAVLGPPAAGSLAERAGLRAGDWVRGGLERRRRVAGHPLADRPALAGDAGGAGRASARPARERPRRPRLAPRQPRPRHRWRRARSTPS